MRIVLIAFGMNKAHTHTPAHELNRAARLKLRTHGVFINSPSSSNSQHRQVNLHEGCASMLGILWNVALHEARTASVAPSHPAPPHASHPAHQSITPAPARRFHVLVSDIARHDTSLISIVVNIGPLAPPRRAFRHCTQQQHRSNRTQCRSYDIDSSSEKGSALT